jgi:hypothetical protein
MAGCAAVLLAVSMADAADPVFTARQRFRIPYQLDQSEIDRLGAVEIQLHVSRDGGRNWNHVDSVPPVEGRFTFEAAEDGEYVFAVRTIDGSRQHHPSGPLSEGLRVIVDTAPPTLQLDATEIDGSRVRVRWQAADTQLDERSLSLEYRTPGESDWQSVQIVPTAAGQTSWTVSRAGTVAVRGSIRDLAGNETSASAEAALQSGDAADGLQKAQPKAPRVPIAQEQPAPGGSIGPESSLSMATASGMSASLPIISPGGLNASSQVILSPATQISAGSPAWSTGVTSLAPQSAQSVRRVNATSFEIGYVLDDVGPSGVSSVDLYLTEDLGKRWYYYGVDQDERSPFSVTVPQDGTYGFAIRVRSGVGLALHPPQPHDRPELLVIVDRMPPQATLLPPRQGQGTAPNQMLIEWTLSDEALAEQPVALYFAPRKEGPWQPITGWQAHTGHYLWTFGPDIPKEVYVRLDARDAAGNIARAETGEPMLVDLSRPTARIIDVESVQ